MKPVTPQQHAACYGAFISDMNKASKQRPNIVPWFNSTLSDVAMIYKLNPTVFVGYVGSMKTFPYPPKSGDYASKREVTDYNSAVDLAWSAMSMDLNSALTIAEVDPTKKTSITLSFSKLKPKPLVYKHIK